MSSELLASGVDNLKGHLAGAFNVLTGSSGDYTDLGIGRKFGGAAAAYSLRDVGAMNGPVVRVRRDSDNSEQDFSALAVPFIADWCNRQVVKPLDVRELVSGGSDDGRTGNFVIAKAAYSLRSLGDRQATVAATGDTVARADGKYVIQVRRSSDDTIKSFTADEVTDGTLVAFVGSGNDGFVRTWYDQSVTDQGGSTATGNHAVQATAGSQPKIVDSGSLVSLGVDFTGGKFMPFTSISAKTVVAVNQLTDTTNFNYLVGRSGGDGGVRTGFGDGTFSGADTAASATADFNHAGGTTHVNGSQSSFLATNKNVYFGTATSGFALTALGTAFVFASVSRSWRGKIAEVIIYDTDQTDNRGAFEANIAENYGISGIPAEDNQVNGFVETWYDQSGNGNDAVQATATKQPKIVNSGSLLTDGILFGANINLPLSGTGLDILKNVTHGNIFSVLKPLVTGTGNGRYFGASINGGTVARFLFADSQATNASVRIGGRSLDGDSFTDLEGTTTHSNAVSVLTGFINYGTKTATLFLNGSQINTSTLANMTAGNTSNTSSDTVAIGDFVSSGSNTSDFNAKEIILFNTDKSSDRADIESNIANHYGITLS